MVRRRIQGRGGGAWEDRQTDDRRDEDGMAQRSLGVEVTQQRSTQSGLHHAMIALNRTDRHSMTVVCWGTRLTVATGSGITAGSEFDR